MTQVCCIRIQVTIKKISKFTEHPVIVVVAASDGRMDTSNNRVAGI